MNPTFKISLLTISILTFICSCNTDDPIITPIQTNNLVKRITNESNTITVADFYYNTSSRLDSIVITDSTNETKLTIRYSFYDNKIVARNYTNGIPATDSSVSYVFNSRLDSTIYYYNSPLILKYNYNPSNLLISNVLYPLGNPTNATPTFINYSNENLLSTTFTFTSGPTPFVSDTSNYTYTSYINNLRSVSSALNISWTTDIGNYKITNSKNLANKIERIYCIGNPINPTIIRIYYTTNITYTFDSNNRVISETRIMTEGSSAPQTTRYTFEYY
jgi:hypothetical protein